MGGGGGCWVEEDRGREEALWPRESNNLPIFTQSCSPFPNSVSHPVPFPRDSPQARTYIRSWGTESPQ